MMHLGWRWEALKNGFRDATAYRVEFLFEILGSALVPASIQLVFWYALFKVGGSQTIAGLTHADLLTYTWVSMLFTQVRGGDHDFELQELIRTGQLSQYLLRPVGVVEFTYIRGLAPRLFIAALSLSAGSLIAFFLKLSIYKIFAAMTLALLGNVIHYQIGASLATSAFLWEEAYSVLMIKNMAVNFLSGELIPLNLFPESMTWMWKYTPFYLYVYGPTQYALGRWSDAEFFHALILALLWIVLGFFMIRLSWSWGIKKYLSLGG